MQRETWWGPGKLHGNQRQEGEHGGPEPVQTPLVATPRVPLGAWVPRAWWGPTQAAPLPRNCSRPILSPSSPSGLSRPGDARLHPTPPDTHRPRGEPVPHPQDKHWLLPLFSFHPPLLPPPRTPPGRNLSPSPHPPAPGERAGGEVLAKRFGFSGGGGARGKVYLPWTPEKGGRGWGRYLLWLLRSVGS